MPGDAAQIDLVVQQRHLASQFAEPGDGGFAAVFATPSMVALLERVCSRLLLPALAPGQTSVGAGMNLRHKAPTALGETITAQARLVRCEGTLFVFDVSARDAAGVVATGEHQRAIVDAASIEISARARATRTKE